MVGAQRDPAGDTAVAVGVAAAAVAVAAAGSVAE
jgi:hypothetical protein